MCIICHYFKGWSFHWKGLNFVVATVYPSSLMARDEFPRCIDERKIKDLLNAHPPIPKYLSSE